MRDKPKGLHELVVETTGKPFEQRQWQERFIQRRHKAPLFRAKSFECGKERRKIRRPMPKCSSGYIEHFSDVCRGLRGIYRHALLAIRDTREQNEGCRVDFAIQKSQRHGARASAASFSATTQAETTRVGRIQIGH